MTAISILALFSNILPVCLATEVPNPRSRSESVWNQLREDSEQDNEKAGRPSGVYRVPSPTTIPFPSENEGHDRPGPSSDVSPRTLATGPGIEPDPTKHLSHVMKALRSVKLPPPDLQPPSTPSYAHAVERIGGVLPHPQGFVPLSKEVLSASDRGGNGAGPSDLSTPRLDQSAGRIGVSLGLLPTSKEIGEEVRLCKHHGQSRGLQDALAQQRAMKSLERSQPDNQGGFFHMIITRPNEERAEYVTRWKQFKDIFLPSLVNKLKTTDLASNAIDEVQTSFPATDHISCYFSSQSRIERTKSLQQWLEPLLNLKSGGRLMLDTGERVEVSPRVQSAISQAFDDFCTKLQKVRVPPTGIWF